MDATSSYTELIRRVKEAALLGSCAGVLGWDERTYLPRQEAQAVGYKAAPYDALLDEYEPGATTAEVTKLFADLAAELVPLIEAVRASGRRPKHDILEREYPVERQQVFGQAAAAAIGFD